ncbi:hypothetical protein ACN47E_009512 [Coniothyrium glycines]
MALSLLSEGRARDLTEAVVTLQNAISSFRKDMDDGRQDFVISSTTNCRANEDGGGPGPHILRLTPANGETRRQMTKLEARVSDLESRLRLHSYWCPSIPSTPSSPTLAILDMADLSNAIALLERIVTSIDPSSSPKLSTGTPQFVFAKYAWVWDPSWKEFHTYLPSEETYIYLSRWRLSQAANKWEHVHMASAELTPDETAEKMGAWEDWKWDAVLGEWCLEIMGGRDGERCCIFGSRWHINQDEEWEYAGGIGSG